MKPYPPAETPSPRISTFTMMYASYHQHQSSWPLTDPTMLGRRYRLDAHVHRSRLTHDSRCWVSLQTTWPLDHHPKLTPVSASSTLDSREGNRRSPWYGFRWWLLLSPHSSGSSGATLSHFHTRLESSLETSKTSALEIRWLHRLLVATGSQILCSPCTRACLPQLRMMISLQLLHGHGCWHLMYSVALAVGAVAERGRMLPCVIFMLIWATLIYDPIACWTWNPHGWVASMGGLDFAGGTPVHISSGSAALAYSLMLGKRRGHGTHELNFRPHNVTQVIIGTVFLWVGWFGFNAGSALSASMRAVMAAVVTNLAASVGGVTWCLLDYRLERKWSAVGFCSGVVAGLVAITPGSGYVPAWSAVIYGVLAGSACNYGTKIKFLLGIDDALDIFAVHAIGGLVGNLCTGFFAA